MNKIIKLDTLVKESKLGVPCGGCQWMGFDPPIKNGACKTCGRTKEQIVSDHGKVELTTSEKEQRKDAGAIHMMGGDIVYQYST